MLLIYLILYYAVECPRLMYTFRFSIYNSEIWYYPDNTGVTQNNLIGIGYLKSIEIKKAVCALAQDIIAA